MTNNQIINEASIHYIAYFLERYADKYTQSSHVNALSDIRRLSNELLDTLGKPLTVTVRRHKNKE